MPISASNAVVAGAERQQPCAGANAPDPPAHRSRWRERATLPKWRSAQRRGLASRLLPTPLSHLRPFWQNEDSASAISSTSSIRCSIFRSSRRFIVI